MPELPEVEEVRRGLSPHVLGVRIRSIAVRRPDFVWPPGETLASLVGRRFVRLHRHGKKLFCIMDDGQTLLLHLGMTGRVDIAPTGAPILPHTHIILTLAGKKDIRFRDPRRFGGVWFYPTFEQAAAREIAPMGKDALEIQPADLAPWRNSRGTLKQRLLSQKDVAGLGNIYVDEALWMSRLHPLQRVGRIRPAQLDELVANIHAILNRSIQMGGTTLRDYRNVANQPGRFVRQLQAYGRGGLPCGRCGKNLLSIRVAARTTIFCPLCQRRR